MTLAFPAPRNPKPIDAPALTWGIIGTGRIADEFMRSLTRHTVQEVGAVASRSAERASHFAERWNIPTAYGSYEELATDPTIDVVYIATPHAFHREQAELCLNAGKHLLIEKPMSTNAADAHAITELAARKGLFVMEALWWRFLPWADIAEQLMGQGTLGDIQFLRADLGEYFEKDDERMFDPALGGGSLLDLGVYLVTLAEFFMGDGLEVARVDGTRTDTGVSNSVAITLTGGSKATGSATAQLYTTMDTWTPSDVYIHGTKARLTLHAPLYAVPSMTLSTHDSSHSVTINFAEIDWESGLCYEIAEVARLISTGATGSHTRSTTATVNTLKILDRLESAL